MGTIVKVFSPFFENRPDKFDSVIEILKDMGFEYCDESQGTIKYRSKNGEENDYAGPLLYDFVNVYLINDATQGVDGYEHLDGLYTHIYIEEPVGNGLRSLEFLYRYCKEYPEAIIWNCVSYAYEKKDIDKLYLRDKADEFWMYKDPRGF